MVSALKSKIRSSGAQSSEVILQITSMADVFTILLVFLLKGYASGAISVTPSAGLTLPVAQGEALNEEVLQVEVSKNSIQVGGVAVTPLSQFRLTQDTSSLTSALKKERKRRQLISESNSEVENNGKLLLVSDKQVPYGTLRAVMRVAAEQGFSDLKLAVIKE